MSMIDLAHVEAEVLGACLLSSSVIDKLALDCDLRPDDLSHPPYAKAWAAILELHHYGTVTPATLAVKIGNKPIVDELLSAAGPVSAIVPNGRLIKRASLRRAWKNAGYKLLEAAEQDDENLVAQAEQALATPTITEDTHSAEAVGDAIRRFLTSEGRVGIDTGFNELNQTIGGGLRPGDCTALGAWTSMGKSVLVDQMLTHASLINGLRCHAYINEMSVADRGLRMIARQTNIPYSRLAVRDLSPDEHQLAETVATDLPFGITDCAQWDAGQMSRHIRANKWDLCAVDLLHNMAYEKESELHAIVSTLAAAARTSGSHLILVCQFNEARAITERLPRPVSRDIRGSGMIKNICANVMLLHREQDNKGDFYFKTNNATLNVDKARHGEIAGVRLVFDPESMRFDPSGPHAIGETA